MDRLYVSPLKRVVLTLQLIEVKIVSFIAWKKDSCTMLVWMFSIPYKILLARRAETLSTLLEQQFIGGDDDKGELTNIEIYWVHDLILTTEVAEFKFSLAVFVSSLTVNMLNVLLVCCESFLFRLRLCSLKLFFLSSNIQAF